MKLHKRRRDRNFQEGSRNNFQEPRNFQISDESLRGTTFKHLNRLTVEDELLDSVSFTVKESEGLNTPSNFNQ